MRHIAGRRHLSFLGFLVQLQSMYATVGINCPLTNSQDSLLFIFVLLVGRWHHHCLMLAASNVAAVVAVLLWCLVAALNTLRVNSCTFAVVADILLVVHQPELMISGCVVLFRLQLDTIAFFRPERSQGDPLGNAP